METGIPRVLSIGSQQLLNCLLRSGSIELVDHESTITRAEEFIREHPNDFDLVVTTSDHPLFSGMLYSIRPDVPVIPVATDKSRDAEWDEMAAYNDLPNTAGLARLYQGDVIEKIVHVASLKATLLKIFDGNETAMEEAIKEHSEATGNNRWATMEELIETYS